MSETSSHSTPDTRIIDNTIRVILRRLSGLMDTRLSDERLDTLFGSKRGFYRRLDHVTFAAERLAPFNPYFSDRSVGEPTQTKELHVYGRLGHITVNPHKLTNAAALTESYIYAGMPPAGAYGAEEGLVRYLSDNTTEQLIPINSSQDSLEQFLDQLIRRRDGEPFTYYLVHGPRGVGKTFLQNHILSKYSERLDESKVIWVRINLTEITHYDDDIEGLIYAQAAKIICRYYDQTSRHFDPKIDAKKSTIDVRQLIDEFYRDVPSTADRRVLANQIAQMRQVFRTGGRPENKQDKKLNSTWVSSGFAYFLWTSALSAGFRFVVVLDGLDVLEATPAAHARFKKFKEELGPVLRGEEQLDCAFVICCRTYTFDRDFLHFGGNAHGLRIKREVYKVAPAPLRLMFERRLEYLRKEVTSGAEPLWSNTEWDQHIRPYKDAMLQRGPGGSSALHYYDEILGDNARAKMQMLQFEYHQYLNRKIGAGAYHILESILKAGRRFPLSPYDYETRADQGVVRVATTPDALFDSRFLPNVMRCASPPLSPAARAAVNETLEASLSQASAGLRLLQFLVAAGSVLTSPPISVTEVCELMENISRVSNVTTQRFLEEWVEYQLIEFENDFADSIVDVEGPQKMLNRIRVLPKANALMRIIPDVAYLSLTAMRIPVNEIAFIADKPLNAAQTLLLDQVSPYFRCAAQDTARDDIADWIISKILNSVAVARLIRTIDFMQSDILEEENISRLSRRLQSVTRRAHQDGLLNVGNVIAKSVIDAIRPVVLGVSQLSEVNTICADLEEAIKNYCERWS